MCGRAATLLAQALLAAGPLREDRDDLARARELDRGLDRPLVAVAPPNLKGAGELEDRAEQRRAEELGLRHEPNLPLRPQRQPERPGVDVRQVVRREDVAAAAGRFSVPRARSR